MIEKKKLDVDLPSVDPIRELLFLCYNGNLPSLLITLLGQPSLLLQPVQNEIGDCPKVEHESSWEKLQSIITSETTTFTVGDLLLCVGCMLKNEKLVEYLSQRGVDFNYGANTDDMLSPLYIACKNQHLPLVKFFISRKVEISSLIVKEYPEMICTVLENYVEKYKVIKENKRKKKPARNTFMLCWENLHLHALHPSWFVVHKYELTRIELGRNRLSKLNEDLFTLLVHLEELDVSCNSLTSIPIQSLASSNLKRINASSNQLTELPEALFNNPKILVIDVSRNQLTSLPHTNKQYKCSSLEKLNCSNNMLTELPSVISGANRLKFLDLSRNKFSNFNKSWKCQLDELNLSYNELEDFSCKHDGFKTLRTLNLTRNKLTFIPQPIFHFVKLETLKLSKNQLNSLPHPDTWKNKRLTDLDLSSNQLSTTPIPDGFLDIETEKIEYNNTCELPVKLFADTLQSLNLSNNLIDEIPETMCQLKSLSFLDLSNNPNLTHLPPKLGLLKNIWSLNLSGLEIDNVPDKLDGMNHVKVLSFLRAKLRQSVPFNRVKLMVVGLEGRGKTTLVNSIQGIPIPPNISTVGISIQQFVLPLKESYLSYLFPTASPPDEIVFSVWDLAGQQIYYATHQCFLTGKALYLVVYNVTHGSEGVDNLIPWLLNIQARAPKSICIIVGTHVDRMPPFRKQETLEKFRRDILHKFQKPGFPAISGCIFVSGTSGENIEDLRHIIHQSALRMNQESEMGKIAPISYLELHDRIAQQAQSCKEMRQPPVLTTEEMLQLASKNPTNDILDFEELCTAAKFLQENGMILHFNDHLRGLNNLFFIDPSWLIDMVALVVTVRQRNPFVKHGYINEDELLTILKKNPSLPEEFIPQYLRLLERFEVLLSLDDGKFLIPCMLPKEKPEIDDKLHHVITSQDIVDNKLTKERNTSCLTRDYHMEYIPAGFWARLIARLVIAVEKWSCQVQRGVQKTTDTSYSKHLWNEGLLITYEDGYFLVEGFHDEDLQPKRWSNKGVAITVWSLEEDFSVMGFIVDHLDMLITEWYPGLGDLNHAGYNLVQKLIPCPVCSSQKAMEIMKCCENHVLNLRTYYSSFFRNEFFVNQFPLDTCACAAISHHSIVCRNHPEEPVMLKTLIPEIMMTDLPHKYSIRQEEFDFDPDTSEKIGDGGAGIVYLGYLGDTKVAIKRSRSVIMEQGHSLEGVFNPSSHSLTRLLDYDDGTIVKAFWEMRQEVLVLCTLQHPNIIEFLGVCFSPLCFVIEFAPMGSLYDILEKRKAESKTLPVLGPRMNYLILFQIAEALKYLHSWNIIYRDLKSENVLVFDMDEENPLNVKLSDYGIAAFATPQGVTGEVGTPAFQAPEVQKDYTYDEKVDVYSYGIWMYELISGTLPFLEYRSGSEIRKAVRSGVRPSFQRDGVECYHPYAELLMKSCWQHNPTSRPSFADISSSFLYNDLLTIYRTYPSRNEEMFLDHITCQSVWKTNFPDGHSKDAADKMLLWNNKKENRTFILLDLKTQQIRFKESLPGPRVSCACQVEENVWLGCETQNVIEVFGYHGEEFPKIKCTFPKLEDEILMIAQYQNEGILTVFTSLANGSLVLFTKMVHHHVTESISYEDLWSRQVINLQTGGKPAKCMLVIEERNELWVGSGNQIVIVDLQTRNLVEHLKATKHDKDQNSLLSLLCTDGKTKVWSSLWKSSLVTEWDIQSRGKMYEYYCSEENSLGAGVRYKYGTFSCLIRQPSLGEIPETKGKEKKEEFLVNNRVVADSLYKRPSLRFPTRTYIRNKSSASSTSSSLYDSFNSNDKRKSMFNQTVTSLRLSGDILWVGRTSGDILGIDYLTGHVISVLGSDNLKLFGDEKRYIQSMVVMDTNRLAACVRIQQWKAKRKSLIPSLSSSVDGRSKEKFQILMFDIWSRDQIFNFNERSREIYNDQL